MAGLGAYGGAGLAEGMMGVGAQSLGTQVAEQSPAMNISADAVGGAGDMVAQKMSTATPWDKVSAGWDVAKANPMAFAKQNAMPLLAATAPMMADEGVQTVTKAPNQGYIRPHTFDPYTGQYTAQTPVKTDEWGSRQFAAGGAVAFAGGGFTNEQIAAYIRDQKLTTPEQINQAAAAFGISPEQMSAVQSPATAPSTAGINAASNAYQQAITAAPELETQNNAWEVSQGLPWANQEQPAAKTTYLGVAPGTQTSYSSDQINDAINVSRSQGYTDAQIAQGAGRFGVEPQTVINALAANPAEGNEYLTQEQMSSMADEAASTNGLAGLAGLQDTFKANAAINDAVRSGYGDMENQFAPAAAAPVAAAPVAAAPVAQAGLPAIAAQQEEIRAAAAPKAPTFTTEQVAAYIHDQNLKTPEELTKAAEVFGITPSQMSDALQILASKTPGATAGARAASEAYGSAIKAAPKLDVENTDWLATQGIKPYAGLPISWDAKKVVDGGGGGGGGTKTVDKKVVVGDDATKIVDKKVVVGGGVKDITPVPEKVITSVTGSTTPIPDPVITTIPGGTSAATPVPKAVISTVGGVSGFPVDPLTLAKQQIAAQGTAKTQADNAHLDMLRWYMGAYPNATPVDIANYVDQIGISPELASRAMGLSPQQYKDQYFDAKFNKMTGDSQAAYQYLMGKGAYPTKSSVGEIMRPYSEATLGIPGDISKKRMLFDPATKTYKANPDYVPVSYEAGNKVYGQSDKAISAYLTGNPSNTIDKTMTWAVQNHVPIEQLAALLGRPISEVQAAYDAAKKTLAGATDATGATGVVDYTGAGDAVGIGPVGDSAAAAAAAAGANAASGVGVGVFKRGGGVHAYAQGGISSLGAYSDGGQLLRGPGDGVSDSIPATIGRGQKAALADGEFVIPARIVSELGNGSTEAGSRALYKMLDRVQHARKKSIGKNRVAANTNAARFLPA
jgi:2-hydroxychromene-2-carboxylate isomerase